MSAIDSIIVVVGLVLAIPAGLYYITQLRKPRLEIKIPLIDKRWSIMTEKGKEIYFFAFPLSKIKRQRKFKVFVRNKSDNKSTIISEIRFNIGNTCYSTGDEFFLEPRKSKTFDISIPHPLIWGNMIRPEKCCEERNYEFLRAECYVLACHSGGEDKSEKFYLRWKQLKLPKLAEALKNKGISAKIDGEKLKVKSVALDATVSTDGTILGYVAGKEVIESTINEILEKDYEL